MLLNNTMKCSSSWSTNSIIMSSKGPNKLHHYKQESLWVRCVVKLKEKYFKTKYRPAGILLNVNAMIQFTFKFQLRFRNNKNCSSIIMNFHTHYHNKYINLQLKFWKNRSYHDRRTAHWYTSLLCCLNRLSSTSLTLLHSGFWSHFILHPFSLTH